MKTFALGAVFAMVGFATASTDPDWESYKKQFKRRFNDKDEEAKRHALFNKSKKRIAKKNANLDSPVFGWTKFSDRTDDEFNILLGRSQHPRVVEAARKSAAAASVMEVAADAAIPTTVDWRLTPGVVSSVKDQGQCGSCWAFSTAETVESQFVLAGNAPIDFSPQQLAAYTPQMYGCGGGDTTVAYDYIQNKFKNNQLGGLATGWYCPYEQSMFTPCNGNFCTKACAGSSDWDMYADYFPVARLSGYKFATPGCMQGNCTSQNLELLKRNVALNGPVSICLNAGAFNDYTGGIMTAEACGSMAADAVDHCVQLVGYHVDAEPSQSYWLVRNSWSTNWGEDGYIRLQMSQNTCGVANEATIPIIA